MLYLCRKKPPVPSIKQKSSQRFLKVLMNVPPQNTFFEVSLSSFEGPLVVSGVTFIPSSHNCFDSSELK